MDIHPQGPSEFQIDDLYSVPGWFEFFDYSLSSIAARLIFVVVERCGNGRVGNLFQGTHQTKRYDASRTRSDRSIQTSGYQRRASQEIAGQRMSQWTDGFVRVKKGARFVPYLVYF